MITPVPQLLRVLHAKKNCPGCIMEKAACGRSKAYEIAYALDAFSLGKKGDLRVRAERFDVWVKNQESLAAGQPINLSNAIGAQA